MAYEVTVPGVTAPGDHKGKIEKSPLAFTEAEYQSRVDATKQKMEEHSLDCMLVNEAGNICYLTGYRALSDYVAQALVLYANEPHPSFYLRRQDAPAAMYMCYMPNSNIVGYPEHYIGDYNVSGFDFIFDTLQARGGIKRVGVELDSLSAATVATIKERFPDVELIDMSGVVMRQRLVKSPAEIQHLRDASVITDKVMLDCYDFFKPGRRECDVYADITAGLIRGTPEIGAMGFEAPNLPGGLQSGTSHITWTEQLIENGKHYNPEFGAARHNYFVGLMRTISMGKPSDKLSDLYKYMVDGCNEAINVVKEGETLAAVAQKYCATVDKGGYWKDSRCGYPIGINWLEDSCSLRVDDPTVMTKGMVFHIMLGTWLYEDFGAIISETFAVTENGCEVFSKVPRELIIID
ncbi:MAG: Xaa-Pro peptidase family protein [Pseudomonadota bacterium]